VLGIVPPARAALRVGFFEQGMDSLAAIELKNALQRGLGQPVLPTLVFDHPSIEALAAHLDDMLAAESEAAAPPVDLARSRPEAVPAVDRDQLISDIVQLTEAEMAALVDRELSSLLGE
jgi:hypothetical protein